MNRREHLLATAPCVAAWPHHREHLIVDWSSAVPLRRDDLPPDPRLRLLRVEGESRWNLCRAYNFALAQARGTQVLKLDADAWPTEAFDPADPSLRLPRPPGTAGALGPFCAFGSGPAGRKGQFVLDHGLLEAVGGFNELLQGYGFDDKDLLARLRHWTGREAQPIPEAWIGVIHHGDAERAELGAGDRGLAASQGLAAMRATRLANRLVAAHCPWGPHSPHTSYGQTSPGVWRADPRSIPHPPDAVAAELEHVRRMTFWGHFLAIPEVFLEALPFSLCPPARGGRWPVRWWHRLWWHTGRRLLGAPVWALVTGRSLLVAGGRGASGGR